MLERYAPIKILKIFLEEPYIEYYLREIAKKTGQSTSTVKSATDSMLKEDLILKRKMGNLVLFKANMGNPVFKHMKMAYSLKKIIGSGLIDYLKETALSITLFGSVARGEDDSNSDIDLLLISKQKPDIERFEKRLKREINLIVYTPNKWRKKAKEDKAFYERVMVDGIALCGDKPVV